MNVYSLGVGSVIAHWPMPQLSVALHCRVSLLTVTVPVGVPLPCTLAPTATLTMIGSPATGPTVMGVIVVVVASRPTVTLASAELDEL